MRVVLVWNAAGAMIVSLAFVVSLTGRTVPSRVTPAWSIAVLLSFALTLIWLVWFSERFSQGSRASTRALRTVVITEAALVVLSTLVLLGFYISDYLAFQFATFFYPVPAVAILVTAAGTLAAQSGVLQYPHTRWIATVPASARWVVPASLLLLGLLQGSSYLWVVGNDFTRYWAVADALRSGMGYPALAHMPVYREAGMAAHSIELPVFPTLLLASFALLGHDTFAAHVPAVIANTLLPWLTYRFCAKAGLSRTIAFASACAVALLPFFRLYTLNAPVPDAVFVALLVGTGWAFLRVLGGDGPAAALSDPPIGENGSPQSRGKVTEKRRAWAMFGLLGGLTALTRPEGLLFMAAMFMGLVLYVRQRRFYWALIPFLLLIGSFSTVMITTFGLVWPSNLGSAARLDHIAANLDGLSKYSLRWYAEPLGLSVSSLVVALTVATVIVLLGIVLIAIHRWQLALLPVAAVLQAGFVLTVDPRVSGADQWFDFYRHVSYGVPFVVLPMVVVGKRVLEFVATRTTAHATGGNGRLTREPAGRRWMLMPCLAVLVLVVSGYELHLLAYPSASYGMHGRQLLTSDMWVSLPDIMARRYQLPQLQFHRERGVMTLDRNLKYTGGHLEGIRDFFEPVSSLATGRGAGYQLSSLIAILFGALFILAEEIATARRGDDPPTAPASARP